MTVPRLAVRAILLDTRRRLLLVNAYPGGTSDLWCAPGGGVEPHSALPENLVREVREETGLTIEVGRPAFINEFHDPVGGFHQVEVFFHATLTAGTLDAGWEDPEGVVDRRRWVAEEEIGAFRLKPASLPVHAWGTDGAALGYDPLERLVR